jgi:hypothetical protein
MATHILTSIVDGGEWTASRLFTHWIGGWAGLRADVDAVAKR